MAENNPFPGENNTGHVWDDDLRELSNPPPTWWTLCFYISIAFVIGYGVIYPQWPTLTGVGYTQGMTGWTQMDEYKKGVAEVAAVRAPFEDRIKGMSAKEILADQELADYISHGDGAGAGKVLFGDNCAACHGSAGQGTVGFPVLLDDDWIWGGSIEKIVETITNGRGPTATIPSPGMTAHAGVLSEAEIDTLAAYAVGLSEGNDDPSGKALFTEKGCIACHGMDAKGMQVLGSANLTDAIWRFDEADKLASAKYTITHGVNAANDSMTRQAEMPTFSNRLSADDIKKLAVYVYLYGGGK
jgi:cytochrome c oxidase cbb3-type subunit III